MLTALNTQTVANAGAALVVASLGLLTTDLAHPSVAIAWPFVGVLVGATAAYIGRPSTLSAPAETVAATAAATASPAQPVQKVSLPTMSLGSFISREIKFGEAAVINLAANSLSAKATQIEALVDTAAPQGVAAVVAAVEKADSSLGPAESGLINGTLTAYEPQLTAFLTPLLAAGEAVIPKVVSAMQALGSQLQTEALATK